MAADVEKARATFWPGLIALAAVAGPGVLAGLSDDDPAGITTYSPLRHWNVG